ncbi:MAG: hypothetical protein NZ807_10140 [Dehalococcoidia bacterium]|nr:hypothetical protein [Dehalococcoidia bacterium]
MSDNGKCSTDYWTSGKRIKEEDQYPEIYGSDQDKPCYGVSGTG